MFQWAEGEGQYKNVTEQIESDKSFQFLVSSFHRIQSMKLS